MTGQAAYLVVGVVLFSTGMAGVLMRRNLLIMLASVEVMLNGVNLTLAAWSRHLGDVTGQVLILFAMLVTAAEVSIALVVAVRLYRERRTIDVDRFNRLRG
jgi:NADH-quinone oxidoreductase subunit K